jgi:two-component system phosphate regulon sensor histidine kinase PhoR
MKKKKVKIKNYTFKLAARIWIINIPAVLILLFLMVLGKLSWISALVSLLCFWAISAGIIILVFKDLDNFINYLNQWTTNFGKDQPIFRRSLFSSNRLLRAFQSVIRIWQQQALSDAHILTNLPDPIILLNNKKQPVFLNKVAEGLFPDNNLKILIKNDLFKKAYHKIKKEPQIFEWQNNERFFQVRLDKLPAPTQKGGEVEVLLHEITDFKIFHQKQNDFFANASHELKTPLAVITGAVETLQGPAKDDPKAQQDFLSLIANQSSHMTNLVQSLLKLARQQTDFSPKTDVSVNQVLKQLIQELKTKAKEKNQTFVFKCDKNQSYIRARQTDLYHLFQNLLENAVKYGDKNKPIQIQTEQKNKKIYIHIQNEGPVIEQTEIPHLFDRFYRGQKTNHQVEGSGLGLSIVQQIIQLYNGCIEVQSSSKTGTIFTVVLPISD